jgi:hypothetical protein
VRVVLILCALLRKVVVAWLVAQREGNEVSWMDGRLGRMDRKRSCRAVQESGMSLLLHLAAW